MRYATRRFAFVLGLLLLLRGSAIAQQTVSAPEAKKEANKQALPCLIVGGHHGMNKAIGYAMGGVPGIFMSGDRFEYRDSVNVDGKLLKPIYKGKDLKSIMQQGVHIVIVDKRAAQPDILAARRECSAEDVVPSQTAEGVRPVVTSTPEEKSTVREVVSATSAPAAQSMSSTAVSLDISSKASGADIEVDGSFVGNTPSVVTLAPGEHAVIVRKNGFKAWERRIRLTGGEILLNAELEPEAGPSGK